MEEVFGKDIKVTQASPNQEINYVIEDMNVTMQEADDGQQK
ncbi:hypothetical protein [Natronomonas salina]|nr:hypothetical protein [Natronomonas salina]